MKKLFRLGLAALLGGAAAPATPSFAQPAGPAASPYALRLASGDVLPPANFAEWLTQPGAAAPDAWQGRVFRLVQFERIPTQAQKQALQARGVEFFDYLPQNAYTAALPATLSRGQLAGFGIRAVVPVAAAWKLAGALAAGEVPAHARRAGGQVEVVAGYYRALAPAQAAQALRAAGFEPNEHDEFAHQLRLTLPETAVPRLAALPWVSSVEAAPAPGEPENFRGRTDHRANAIAADYGAGRHYTGAGVTVGHGDDGIIGPHIDYQGRIDISTAGPNQGNHGDHVAGIIMGAGNLNPRIRGQAVGAFNFYQTYPNNLTTAPANYANVQRRVRVTNSSYGDGNNAGYTSFTRTVDGQMRQLPYLVHVFSSGNSGTSDFNYGAGAGWGNITGGHKMGKNVVTVGNVDYQDVLASSSSRGPANDGRIKPDVCAVGTSVTSTVDPNTYAVFTGTSMACPGTAGVLAQLVGAYRSLRGGQEAPGALLKAILLNTAEDLGNPGPDFRYGYGRINALRAVRALEGQAYFRDTLAQGQTRTFTLNVPAGKSQLRVLLHWADFEAAVNARPALVNNLDLTLTAPGAATPLLPWVLDHRPTAAQLNANAARGRDSLNNAEQITVDAPAAGTYTLTVRGRAVPQGPQGFWLTYSYLEPGVEMTYPLGGEGFVPGEPEVLRWDAADSSQPFALDYSADNGATWQVIATGVPGTRRYFDWTVPAGLTSGQMRVRVRQGAATGQSAAPFTAAPVPAGLRTDYRCGAGVGTQLSWTASAGATSYTLFKLGALYMDSVTTVTATTVQLPALVSTSDYWFAVRANGANGLRSRRSLAIYQPSGNRNCPGPPAVAFAASQTTVCPGSVVQLADSSESFPTSWQWAVSPSAGVTFVGGTTAASQNPRLQFANPGTYSVTLTATNSFGPGTLTQSGFLTVTNGQAVPFAEKFRNLTTPAAFPPAGWRVVNPSSLYTWQLSPAAVVGPDTVSRRLPVCLDYNDMAKGAEDYLITPPLNLGGTARPALSFWVAYAAYDAASPDGLRVDISTDCGQTFRPTGYLKSGVALATVPNFLTTAFTPTAPAQWRQETVDLTSFRQPTGAGPQPVLLRFVNLNQYGNNLYLTNVRLAEATGLAARNAEWAAQVSLFPNPAQRQLTLSLPAALTRQAVEVLLLNGLGQVVQRRALPASPAGHSATLDVSGLARGVYSLQLATAEGPVIKRLVVE